MGDFSPNAKLQMAGPAATAKRLPANPANPANIGITMDRYLHVTATMQREAADRLDALLGG